MKPATKSKTERYALLTHQQQSIKKMKPLKRFFDMSDAGTGKTLVEIHDYITAKDGGRMIILAPLSLLEAAWVADFRKFAPEVTIIPAYAHNRADAFKSNADVIVVNQDAIKDIDNMPPKWLRQFKRMVVDESGAYKHHTSARSKAMKRASERIETIRLLNGTPWTNSVTDVWHQMYLVDEGRRLGNTFSAFRVAACEPKTDENGRLVWLDRPGIENVVVQLIKDVSIRHKLEDCTDIPENHQYHVFYEMPAKARAQYNELASKKLLEFKDKIITAVNGGVLYGKLLQFASGAVYTRTPGDQNDYQLIDDGRYKLVLDLVEAREQSVVFFLWQHQKDLLVAEALKRKLRAAVIDGSVSSANRLKIVEDFQAGKLDVIFAHPKSAAHGLTLTKGVATIWASPTHDLEWFLQGFKRIYRIGQTKRTENIIVLARNTIDERVYFDILSNKNARQTDFMNLATELCK